MTSSSISKYVINDPALLPWGLLHNDSFVTIESYSSVSEAVYSCLELETTQQQPQQPYPLTKINQKKMATSSAPQMSIDIIKQKYIHLYNQYIFTVAKEACIRAYVQLQKEKRIDLISAAICFQDEKDEKDNFIIQVAEEAMKEIAPSNNSKKIYSPYQKLDFVMDQLSFKNVAQYVFYCLFHLFDASQAYELSRAYSNTKGWMSTFNTLQSNYLAVRVFRYTKKALTEKFKSSFVSKLLAATPQNFEVVDTFPSLIQDYVNRSTNQVLRRLKSVETRAFVRILDYSETAIVFKQWIIEHRLVNLFRTVQKLANYLGEGYIRSSLVYTILNVFYRTCFVWDVNDTTLVYPIPKYWHNWVKEACDSDTWKRIKESLPRTLYFAWTYTSELLYKVRANESVVASYMMRVPLSFSKEEIYKAVRNILLYTKSLCERTLRPFRTIGEPEYKLVQTLLKIKHVLSNIPFTDSTGYKLRKYPISSEAKLAFSETKEDEPVIISIKDLERKQTETIFVPLDVAFFNMLETDCILSFSLDIQSAKRITRQIYVLVEYMYINLYSLSRSTRSLLLYYG
jgi:hypothetical protein